MFRCKRNPSLNYLENTTTCNRVFSKTETFFSEYGYRPHVTGVFGHRKRRFSSTLSRVESFENGDSSYSCGRAKMEVFKYDDVIPRFKARSSAHTIRKRYVWTPIFLRFYKYREKNLRFQKYSDYVWMVKYDSTTLRVDADSF